MTTTAPPDAARLAELVRATRATLDAAARLLDDPALAPLDERLRGAEQRHGFLGEAVLVALAGGTGSGKSSLLNALAGEQVTRPGVLRPTTAEPLAWVPMPVEAPLTRLLDAFGIDQRVGQQRMPHLAVIDLPDYDSVEPSHRAIVDRLVPRVDAVVWVVDPEKYNDAALHEGYLRPLAQWHEQFVFVLNQVDRLRPADVAAVTADLRDSLRRDGLPDPTIVAVAAAPIEGAPRGIDELRALLHERLDDKAVARRKLLTDLRAVAGGLVQVAAIDGERRLAPQGPPWEQVRAQAAELVGEGVVDRTAVEQAARVGARTAVAAASGPAGRVLHAARRSPAGRVLGLPGDEPVDEHLLDPARVSGRELDAVAVLREHVTATSLGVPSTVGRHLRQLTGGDWLEEQVRLSSRAARSEVTPPRHVARRGWWPWLAVVQTLVTVAVVAGLVLTWLDPSGGGPGPLPHPLVLVAVGLLAGLAVRRLAARSGRAAGRATALAHRAAIAARVDDELQRRVGAPVAAALDDWESLRAGITTLRTTLS